MKRVIEIEIRPEDVDKRQTLAWAVDRVLMLDGARVTAGEYIITIERKTAARVRKEKAGG